MRSLKNLLAVVVLAVSFVAAQNSSAFDKTLLGGQPSTSSSTTSTVKVPSGTTGDSSRPAAVIKGLLRVPAQIEVGATAVATSITGTAASVALQSGLPREVGYVTLSPATGGWSLTVHPGSEASGLHSITLLAYTQSSSRSYNIAVNFQGAPAPAEVCPLRANSPDHQAMYDLIDANLGDFPATAVQSGDFNDPTVWAGAQVPTGGAVFIPKDIVVRVGGIVNYTYNFVVVEGTLLFAPSSATSRLSVGTLIVGCDGSLKIGSEETPLAADKKVEIVVDGRFGLSSDPRFLQNGILSHGAVQIFGTAVTPFVPIDQPAVGDAQIRLRMPVTDWKAGDEIALGYVASDKFRISSIVGNTVTLDHPLATDVVPSGSMPAGYFLYAANLSRNIVVRSANPEGLASQRGHCMFMGPNVRISSVAFLDLGETDKSRAITPATNPDGTPIEDPNVRGRYPVHFHINANLSWASTPALVSGSVVQNSPGWGMVNHSSYVNFEDNVAYNVAGAGFVTEIGNEIGLFKRNLAMHVFGAGDAEDPATARMAKVQQSFGFEGDGFWLQGAGVKVLENVAIDCRYAAIGFYNEPIHTVFGDETSPTFQFLSANLDNPSIAQGAEFIAVNKVPVTCIGNLGIGIPDGRGIFVQYNNGPGVDASGTPLQWSLVQDNTIIDARWAYRYAYSSTVHMKENRSYLVRKITSHGVFAGIENGGAGPFRFENNEFYGELSTGITPATQSTTEIIGGKIENADCGISIMRTIDHIQPRIVKITEVDFGASALKIQVGGDKDDEHSPGLSLIKETRQDTVLWTRAGVTKQIYFDVQVPTAIPYPVDPLTGQGPTGLALDNKTSASLATLYGWKMAAALAPADAIRTPEISGGVVSPTLATYSPRILVLQNTMATTASFTPVFGDARDREYRATGQPVVLTPGRNLVVAGTASGLVWYSTASAPPPASGGKLPTD